MSESSERFVEKLASESLRERRASRRWGIFFKILIIGYVFAVTWFAVDDTALMSDADLSEHAAVIRISGLIVDDSDASADVINRQLRAAFESEDAKGIILQINSPGGSAVESHRIYREIRRLREKFPNKKVYAVAGDFCASGGYFIAAAADEIYADPGSVIGSIGVIFSSFGFAEAMEKLGIERRVLTAGRSKNLLDPFAPQSYESIAQMRSIINDIHRVFIDAVREGRGERLPAHADVFDGGIYSGTDSAELGLIDGFADTAGVARDIIGVESILYYTESDWLDTLTENLGLTLPALTPHLLPTLR